MIHIQELHYAYDRKEVLSGINLSVERGDYWAVMGLNGAGKSTLLKVVAGLLPLQAGRVEIQGKSLPAYRPERLAQEIAYVPQKQNTVFDFTVWESVMMGRNPWQGRWERENALDREIVGKVLHQCHLYPLKERMLSQLSGGEMQRALIARAMAQEAPVMLLDEPLSNLDIIHKYEIMDILAELNATRQTTILIILHDFPVTKQYARQTVILKEGRVCQAGATSEVLTPSTIRQAFNLPADLQVDGNGNVGKRSGTCF